MFQWLKRKDGNRMSDLISFSVMFLLIQVISPVYSLTGFTGFLIVIGVATLVYSTLQFLLSRLLKEKDRKVKFGVIVIAIVIVTTLSTFINSYSL